MVLGRTEAALSAYFKALKGKEDVKVVVMDLLKDIQEYSKDPFPKCPYSVRQVPCDKAG